MSAASTINFSDAVSATAVALALASQITVWVTWKSPRRREVSFVGTPVDKKDFDRFVEANDDAHERIFAKIGGVERGANDRLDKRMAEVASELKAIHGKMEQDKMAVIEAGNERGMGIHGRINDLLAAVSELRGQIQQRRS